MKCAREAVKLIKTYIDEEISFNQETTLSGRSIINNIKRAKQKGYTIILNYIGVDTPEIAKERVDLRVKKGGHGIPHEDIDRRYFESLENLNKIISICDEINIYDNTDIFKLVACVEQGKLVWKNDETGEEFQYSDKMTELFDAANDEEITAVTEEFAQFFNDNVWFIPVTEKYYVFRIHNPKLSMAEAPTGEQLSDFYWSGTTSALIGKMIRGEELYYIK